jgi:hypothetical protein
MAVVVVVVVALIATSAVGLWSSSTGVAAWSTMMVRSGVGGLTWILAVAWQLWLPYLILAQIHWVAWQLYLSN